MKACGGRIPDLGLHWAELPVPIKQVGGWAPTPAWTQYLSCCLVGYESSIALRNVGIMLHHYSTSQLESS